MKQLKIWALTLVAFAPLSHADKANMGKETIKLYQVGKEGKYCVSLTPDDSGCISGVDSNGTPVNRLDIIQGRKAEFINVSDAVHNMEITGTNAVDLPPQGPGAAVVQKTMQNVDMTTQKIKCSYHGDQLGVGYRVPSSSGNPESTGHDEMAKARGLSPGQMGAGGFGGGAGRSDTQPIVPTKLADVAVEVLAKGNPAEVARLVAARPELMNQLQTVRPLLAKEISSKGGLATAAGGTGTAGGTGAARIAGGMGGATSPTGGTAGDSASEYGGAGMRGVGSIGTAGVGSGSLGMDTGAQRAGGHGTAGGALAVGGPGAKNAEGGSEYSDGRGIDSLDHTRLKGARSGAGGFGFGGDGGFPWYLLLMAAAGGGGAWYWFGAMSKKKKQPAKTGRGPR